LVKKAIQVKEEADEKNETKKKKKDTDEYEDIKHISKDNVNYKVVKYENDYMENTYTSNYYNYETHMRNESPRDKLLFTSCIIGSYKNVEFAIRQGADVNFRSLNHCSCSGDNYCEHMSPLALMVSEGNIYNPAILCLLIEHEAECSTYYYDYDDDDEDPYVNPVIAKPISMKEYEVVKFILKHDITYVVPDALYECCRKGSLKIYKYLLKKLKYRRTYSSDDIEPKKLEIAIDKLFLNASKNPKMEIFDYILKKQYSLKLKKDAKIIKTLAKNNHFENIDKFLLTHSDEEYNLLLMWAIRYCNVKQVELLFEKSFNISQDEKNRVEFDIFIREFSSASGNKVPKRPSKNLFIVT